MALACFAVVFVCYVYMCVIVFILRVCLIVPVVCCVLLFAYVACVLYRVCLCLLVVVARLFFVWLTLDLEGGVFGLLCVCRVVFRGCSCLCCCVLCIRIYIYMYQSCWRVSGNVAVYYCFAWCLSFLGRCFLGEVS